MSFFIKTNIFLKKYIKTILLIVVLVLAFVIRLNNIFRYNTWWADDGGAHIEYIETILEEGRLPSMSENYLAWHEPAYYIIQAGWTKLGMSLGISSDKVINWQEFLGVILFGVFIFLVYKLSIILTKNYWLALLNVFVFSTLFTSVKISAYVNNEFPVQILIILLILLFCRFKLLESDKHKVVVWWSVILGLAMLVKLTAVLVLLSAVVCWLLFFIVEKKKHVLVYIILSLIVVGAINLPWLAYKKINFGTALAVNIYEQNNAQNILISDGWDYLFKINPSIIVNEPFWISGSNSFTSILLADTFSDHYNLFNHVDEMDNLPEVQKFKTSNYRFTTALLNLSALWSIRLGFIIFLMLLIGLLGSIWQMIKNKKIDWQKMFLYILIVVGLLALIYNNLRFPYLERGVLKANFIFYIFPLISLVSYGWWWQTLEKKKWFLFVLLFLPWIIYTVVASPILFV
ncbi:MAG: glycosyltransferase family 39 protein [Candidatus Magasanikbacteria bacterium]